MIARGRDARRSIRARLLWPLSAIVAIGSIGLAVGASVYGRRAADASHDVPLAGAALAISERLSVVDGRVLVDIPASAFDILSLARDDRVFHRVIGPDGQTITGYDQLRPSQTPLKLGKPVFQNAHMFGEAVRVVTVRRALSERTLSGSVDVMVAQTTRARRELAGAIWNGALVGVALIGLAMLGLAWWSVGVALRPLMVIDDALLAKGSRDLTPLEVDTPRELAHTVAAINQFLVRIRAQINAGQDFMADVSHQLRTALTAIRALSQSAAEEGDPARARELAHRLHGRAVGLSRLATQIMNRAMVIHRADAVPLEPLDLRAVAVALADDDRDQDIIGGDWSPPGIEIDEAPLMARGDMVSLMEAMRNLFGNARRHGRAPVTIIARRASGGGGEEPWAELMVHDAGVGVLEAEWPTLGERFHRGGGGAVESAGLGLAIARAVAVAHDGRMVVRRPASGGFEIGLALPLLNEEAPS